MPMHIYTSWVVHTSNLVELSALPWAQLHPQKFADGHSDYYRAPTFSCRALINDIEICISYVNSDTSEPQESHMELVKWHIHGRSERLSGVVDWVVYHPISSLAAVQDTNVNMGWAVHGFSS